MNMTNNFQANKTIKKTRKEHVCEHCGLVIPKGVSCEKFSGVWEGEFFSMHEHTECMEEYRRINQENYPDEWNSFSMHREYADDGEEWFLSWRKKIAEKYEIETFQVTDA